MKSTELQRLLELSWRRPLSPREAERLEALLAANPAARADWQLEAALTAALRQLPDAPLASNFTAQVLCAAQAGPVHRAGLVTWWQDWARHLWPKVAWAALVAALAVASSFQWYGHSRRVRIAQALASIPGVDRLPAPELLQDFDAIQELSQVRFSPNETQTVPDDVLLTALQ